MLNVYINPHARTMWIAARIIKRHTTDSFADRSFIHTSTQAPISLLERQNLI
jgi:hypothetical protein